MSCLTESFAQALLITNGFEAQGDLLSLHDVEAWYWALGAAQVRCQSGHHEHP